jgi:hypothetical protein
MRVLSREQLLTRPGRRIARRRAARDAEIARDMRQQARRLRDEEHHRRRPAVEAAISKHAVERWQEKVEPGADPARAGRGILGFLEEAVVRSDERDGEPDKVVLLNRRWPGVVLMAQLRCGFWVIATVIVPEPVT